MTANEKQVDLRADISRRKPLTLEPFQVRPYMPTQANSTSRGDIQRRHSYTEENINKTLLTTNTTNAFCGRNSI